MTAADAPGLRRVGRLDEGERWEAIAGAAAVVVPGSLESLSLLALEAWALGRPCLLNAASPVLAGHLRAAAAASAFSGAAELAARAAELIDDPARGRRHGRAGPRVRVRDLSLGPRRGSACARCSRRRA